MLTTRVEAANTVVILTPEDTQRLFQAMCGEVRRLEDLDWRKLRSPAVINHARTLRDEMAQALSNVQPRGL